MKKIKNIMLNCEEIMNNLYDKSDIFTLLNILKKNFIQNEDDNYETIIESLINNLNNDNFMQEYNLLLSNYLNYTDLNKTIRVKINELQVDNNNINNNYEEFLFIQEFTTSSDILENIKKTEKNSLIGFYIKQNDKIKEINKIVKNINPVISKIYQEYNGKITKENAESKRINDLLSGDNDMINNFKDTYNSFSKQKINNYQNIKLFIFSENDDNCEIAELYKKYIRIYNNILDGFQKFSKNYKLKHSNKRINLQFANLFQILQPLSENQNEDNNNTINFLNFIKKNITHKIKYNQNTQMINYNTFKGLHYDLKKIEKNILENNIINKEKMNDKLIYFNYAFEDNQNNNKGNIQNLIDIFESNHQKKEKISEENKGDIMDLIRKLRNNEIEFLEALQKIISCIKEKENCDDEQISNIIQEYTIIMDNVDKEIINFFMNNNFVVCNLMSIFESVEEECFDSLCENINQKYKENFDHNLKNKFDNLMHNNDRILNRENLKKILMKFVIRFLLKNESINVDENCFEIIQNNNGLYKNYSNQNNQNNLAIEMGELSDLNIPVCQVIDLIKNISNSSNGSKPKKPQNRRR